MTGYGGGSASQPPLAIGVEVSSVNRRNLEVALTVPREWQALEKRVTEQARERFVRGKISVAIRVDRDNDSAGLSWDDAELTRTLERLKQTAHTLGLPFEPDVDALIRLVLSQAGGTDLPELEPFQNIVEQAVDEAFAQLLQMRTNEGAALRADLEQRLGRLGEAHDAISEDAPGSVERYREVLFQRLRQAGLEIDLQDERVLREIALFADRCDISEELTRLRSHLDQGLSMLDESEPVGRKLDFLCQEIHRELNTIGSKANNLSITRTVIEAKNELERFREQVQNVE
ncbi:MAG: YicC/YloC family endoribonuclease [Opitutales bacterium]